MKRDFVQLDYGRAGKTAMPASLFGIWAVHRCPHEPENPDAIGWRITHAPSGYNTARLADGMAYKDACDVARLLRDRAPDVEVDASDEDKRIIETAFAEVLGGRR